MAEKYTADDIQSVTASEHMRLRPMMYFEQCFSEKSLDILPFEVLCHAFDEYFDGNCREITLTLWSDSFSVVYDTGMSLRPTREGETVAEIMMTKMMACHNLKKHLAIGEEYCQIGMMTINLASSECKLTTVSNNEKASFIFKAGETESKSIVPYETEEAWTEIVVKPDKQIFNALEFTFEGVDAKANVIRQKLSDLIITIDNRIE
jgi:DNA gyrase/topoisomerase IV subunit B